MRPHSSLHLKVGIAVVGTIVVLSAVYMAWDTRFYRRRLFAELEHSARILSTVILNSLIKLAMVGKHPELLQESIQKLAQDPSILRVYLLDPLGTVRFASERDFIGHRFHQRDPGCRDCHSLPGRRPYNLFLESSGVKVLRTVTPLPNRPECRTCHLSEREWIGILIVDSSTAEVESSLRVARQEMLIKAGATVLSMLAVLAILMNKLVIVRLKKLTAATALLAREADPARDCRPAGSDEISQLESAFKLLADGLGRSSREVKEKERMRSLLLEKIVRVQEEERKRVSRELHDQLGPSLSALLLELEPNESAACASCEHGDRIIMGVRYLIDEVHQLAWELRPSILDDYGLDSALQRYLDETSQKSGIKVHYQNISPPQLARIPGWIEVVLYRVAQEAITNVVRHSGAGRASVVLLRREDGVMLLIEDEGCGFQYPNNGRGHKGLGLIGMQERVAMCGGRLIVETNEGCGTTIKATIPVEEISHEHSSNDR